MRSAIRAKLALSLSVLVLAALALSGFARLKSPPLVAGQILTIAAESLTTYLPDAPTAVNDVQPRVEQRGVGVDGGLRAGAPHGMAIAGNPFGVVWSGETVHNGVRLDTGSYSPWEIDIALPSDGPVWTVGRSFGCNQTNTAGHVDSQGPMGFNWTQVSQPEIVFYDDTASAADDFIYLVYGADRYVEYQRFDASSDEFRGRNGAAGVFLFVEDTSGADTFVLTDQRGTEFTFFGFDGAAATAAGQLWKVEDEAGNVNYVGSTTKADAITDGYVDNSGNPDHGAISKAYDAAGRRYTYTYSGGLLTQVAAQTKTGGSWHDTTDPPTGTATVAQVDYSYYTSESYGDAGDLKLVTITTPLTDSGVSSTRKKHFRYWEGAFDATSSPGHVHALKYVFDFEGVRNFDWTGDSDFDEDFLAASNGSLESYAAAYFEYDSSHRITEAWWNGSCGCGGGSTGTHTYEYETNSGYSDGSGYDEEWARRTVVAQPDGTYLTQYFDEAGQPLHRVLTDDDPDNTSPAPDRWVTAVTRDSSGLVTQVSTPANITGYTHDETAFTISTSTTAGLVWVYAYISSGDMTGFLQDRKFRAGTTVDPYFLETLSYTSASKTVETDLAVVRPFVASKRQYPVAVTAGTSGSTVDSYAYTMYSGSLIPEKMDTTFNAVDTAKNGSGSSNTSSVHYTEEGRVDFESSPIGYITYHEYENGQLEKLIHDADTTRNAAGQDFDGVSIPTGFATSGTAIHEKVVHAYDAQGRRTTSSPHEGLVTLTNYSRLADQRLVTLSYPGYDETGPVYYGPVDYTVRNHAGEVEAQASIALTSNQSTASLSIHVDETDSDPISAIDGLGELCRLTISVLDEPGARVEESRLYFNIPASSPGSDGTNYDATTFGYDDSGRQWRAKEPSGTIRRTAYDALGRVVERWLGTNDSTFTGGESSGTDDMVKIEALEYDGDADDGNGYLTERTLYVEGSTTDERVTAFQSDVRGNVLLETNPEAPHLLHEYDNLARRIATGSYSSTASITVGTDLPTSEATNRLALSQTYFDERGRTWKTVRHEVDATDGSLDENIPTEYWFDAEGRQVKMVGPQLTKTFYDRMSRVTHEFVLANTNDTAYADADDVGGDVVLEEHQTTYDADDGTVIMRATISRLHGDRGISETKGALDTNADADALEYTAANLAGRIQITGLWYDALDRLEDQVQFGTYGGSDFDRDGMSAPARSATALRTTYSYATDGTVKDVTDPRALVRRAVYDDAGRVTQEIRNYEDGTPSGTDSDVTVLYGYTDGLRTTITADLPAGSTDQVTTYTYGTVKGSSPGESLAATGHMLQKITYPDSASGSDVVSLAYNAQGQEIYKKDQAGNIIERDYDDVGRLTHVRISTLDGDFDGAVRRISTAYDSLGRRSTVTQYDDPDVGEGDVVDEVKFTYDGWGNVSKFEQDRNSTVGDTTSTDDYEVSYAYERGISGRRTVRRDTMTLPSGATIDYNYSSGLFLHDDETSRVSFLEHGATVVASYLYNGLGHLVGTDYGEPDVMSNRYGSTPSTFPDLDLFNRPVVSKWTKDLTTDVDFYHIDIDYDENSNITLIEDSVHAGFDVEYSIDDVDRLTQAEEGDWDATTTSITSRTRDQIWTLDHVGNWDRDQLDLDGDDNFNETDEWDDCRTHNDVNELVERDLDCSDGGDITLSYDEAGNLIDDGSDYEYEYDAFYRLRKVYNQSTELVAEYRYNGLNYRIAEHIDTDEDLDVDGSDDWRYFAYDERWRIVASFIEDETDPREEFLHHAAGLDGNGGSSYIDEVVMRDRDTDADTAFDERLYYCQNWRADVSALVDDTGQMMEWAKYSAYGVPFGLPGGDTDSDGVCDAADVAQVQSWSGTTYDVRGDLDLDGYVDSTDESLVDSIYEGISIGWRELSDLGSRIGFGGASSRGYDAAGYYTRYRALDSQLGVWVTRDPFGYVDQMNLYWPFERNPLGRLDPLGAESVDLSGTLEVGGIIPGHPETAWGTALGDIPPQPPPPPPDPTDPTDPCDQIQSDRDRCLCYAKQRRANRDAKCNDAFDNCMGVAAAVTFGSTMLSGGLGGILAGAGGTFYCTQRRKACYNTSDELYELWVAHCNTL